MNTSAECAKVKYSYKDYKDSPHHAPSDSTSWRLLPTTGYTVLPYYRITATETKSLFNTSSQHRLLDTTDLKTLSD